jgi:hypothetical protein
MNIDSMREFLLSPQGRILALFARGFIAALLICGGIQLLDFKNLASFFTLKRVISLFLLILGARFLVGVFSLSITG